jgi:hypothetical protein
MAYSKTLEQLIFSVLPDDVQSRLTCKNMFGGLCFMLNGNMCFGIHKKGLMLRIGKENWETIKNNPEILPMDFTGKPMKGWAMIAEENVQEKNLLHYLDMGMNYAETLPKK